MVAVGHRRSWLEARPAYLVNPLIAQVGPLVLHADAERRAAGLRRCPRCDLLAARGEDACRHCASPVPVGIVPAGPSAGSDRAWLWVAGVVAAAIVLAALLIGALPA